MNKKRLIVIGGGAAGFFCAVNAARMNPALEVVILEKTGKLLAKVKVSGGGRCNVTHDCSSIAEMSAKYPRGGAFLKKAFHRFFTNDTIAWFLERGVALKTEADGRMFPVSNTSQTIIDCLLKEANRYGVVIRTHADVRELIVHDREPASRNKRFEIRLDSSRAAYADFVCIAGGGYPKPGQYDWIRQPGHDIESPVPSLFTFNIPGNEITALMGVSVERAMMKIAGTKLSEEGPLLITHWGMSGPVVLKLSAWGARLLAKDNYHFTIIVNWVPDFNEQTLREKIQQIRFDTASKKMINRNPFELPNRLWEYLLKQSGIPEILRWADLPAQAQNKLIRNLCAQEFTVKGKTTFKEEFVTAGGILLTDIDHNTMQSKKVPGLFFAGEVLDVDGVTGGYNFQNAWTTGWIAAKGVGMV